MGQAFRRAAGKIKIPPAVDQSPPSKVKNIVHHPPPPPVGLYEAPNIPPVSPSATTDEPPDETPRFKAENVLEEKDPQYDAMLNQMVGRIKSKAGGKAEMGEAFVVERPGRSLPKLRNTKPDSGRYEGKPAPPGTLNVAQLRHIMLLHQGKADDHSGPMDVNKIAEMFRVDVAQVQRILQFLTLPPNHK